MLYLIRLDVRQPDGVSLSEFREIWHRDAVATQESRDSGIIQSFKVVGRWTVFALAEFSDNVALDEALAGLPIVENFGSAVEIEVVPVRPYDKLDAWGRASTAPAEEPARPEAARIAEDVRGFEEAPEQAPAEPEEPAAVADPARPDEADQRPVQPDEVGQEPERPEEVGQVAEVARGLEGAPAGPGESAIGPVEAEPKEGAVSEEPAAGPEQPEEDQRPERAEADQDTEVFRNLRASERAPTRPDEGVGRPEETEPGKPAAAESEQPEVKPGEHEEAGQTTQIIRGLDEVPGRAPAGPEEPAAVGEPEEPMRSEADQAPGAARSEEGSITGMIRSLDAAKPEQPEEVGEVTEVIRGLDAVEGRAPTGPEEPAAAGEPEEAARSEADQAPGAARSEEGSITGMIRSLDAPEEVPTGLEEQVTIIHRTVSRAAPPEDPAVAEPETPRLLLEFVGGPAGSETFEIGRAGATLGRTPDNSIQVLDERLSRQHARIEFKDGDYWLTDLDSSNGTFVNQARLDAPHRLRSGDVIGLGSTRLSVTVEAAEC